MNVYKVITEAMIAAIAMIFLWSVIGGVSSLAMWLADAPLEFGPGPARHVTCSNAEKSGIPVGTLAELVELTEDPDAPVAIADIMSRCRGGCTDCAGFEASLADTKHLLATCSSKLMAKEDGGWVALLDQTSPELWSLGLCEIP